MIKTAILSSILMIILILGCTNEQFDSTETDTVVVEGYLYAGLSLDSLKLSQLIPLIIDEGDVFEITNAEVYIRWNENDFLLTPSEEVPGNYNYEGTDLFVLEGETYELYLEYFGKSITATTTVPSKPKNLELSAQTIEMAPIETFEDLRNLREIDNLEVYWENDEADFYYTLVENIEDSPEEINQLDFDGIQRPNFNFITQPTNLDVSNVRPFSLTQYGTYQVVVYHVNQAYVDLYDTSEQDSRNLTEPLSNIEDGLGVFTSFSSDTVYFEVVKP